MANELTIKITAADGASKTFLAIERSATQAGRSISNAGTQGAKGMDELGRGADTAGDRLSSLNKRAGEAKLGLDDLGGGLTAVGAGLVYAGNAALDQEQVLIGLRRAYGDAADEMIRFADQMADTSIFNDDDILRGERYFSTLRNNYDLTIEQVQQLMQVTADLASAHGIGFEDASSRVTAAIRGEAEAAELLSLTMNQQSIDRGNLTLSMSNQEAAQFRLNALLEQAAPFQGTAAALMETEVGTRAKLTNAIQDNAQALAGFLGPLPTLISGLGMTSLGLTTMVGTTQKAVTTLRSSSLAMTALGVATNPVTIGLGALVAIGAVAVDSFMDQKRAAEEYAASLRTLDDTQEMLRRRGDEEIANLSQQAEDRVLATRELLTARSDFETYLAEKEAELGRTIYVGDPEYDMYLTAWDQSMQKIGSSAEDTTAVLAKFNEAIGDPNVDIDRYLNWAIGLMDAAAQTELAIDDAAAVQTILNTELSEFSRHADTATSSTADFGAELERLRSLAGGSRSDVDDLTGSVNRIDAALQDGSLSAADLEAYLADLDRQMASGAISWALYQERVAGADEALLGLGDTIKATGTAVGEGVFDAAVTGLEATTDAAEENAAAVEAAEEAWNAFGTALGTGFRGAIDQTAGDIADLRQFIADTTSTMLELTGDADITSRLNLTGAATDASILAENLTDAAGALENLQRIVIGNTDAIGGQVQGLEDWALELINVRGTWGEIDDLLNEGRISLDKYNQAQVAQEQISAANATVQRDLLAIQAAQAPILAQSAESTAAYVQSLREMNDGIDDTVTGAQDQLTALALMDQGYQSQLLKVMEMADALDDLGSGGEAAFTQMIESMVALDPAMAAVLEQVGFIDNVVRDSEGRVISYDVRIDGADGAMSEIERLTLSIDALTLAMGGVPPSVDIEVNADMEPADTTVRDWAQHGYTGGYGAPTIPVDADVAPADATVRDWASLGYTGGYVQVPVDADTGPAALSLNAFEPPVINVPVEFTSALGGGLLGAAEDAMSALALPELVVPAPDTSAANAAIDGVEANLADLDGNTAMTYINVLDSATDTILDVGSLLAGLDAASATVMINANADNAYGVIADMQAYNGTVLSTSYVDIVTRRVGSPFSEERMGGMVSEFAMGGVTIRAGEAGYEMAHFPTGGVAMLPHDGLYTVPVGTYIQPHSSVSGAGNITVDLRGAVFGSGVSRAEVRDVFATEIIPAFRDVIRDGRRSMVSG